MSTKFASDSLTASQLNSIVKKLGGHDMALRFLRNEPSVSEPTPSWREKDGVIYFSVASDDTTGEDWIKHLEGNGFCLGAFAKQTFRSPSFKPTNGVTEVAVFKGMLFVDNDRIMRNIRAYAEMFKTPDKRKLGKPGLELVYLIREKFTDKEIEAMGLLHIVVMNDNPTLLDASPTCYDRQLGEYCNIGPDIKWNDRCGFAFVVS